MEPTRFLKSSHLQYPDNDDVKPLTFVVEDVGDFPDQKHVYLMWPNGEHAVDTAEGEEDPEVRAVSQLVQLYGNPGGYRFYHPVVKIEPPHSSRVRTWSLGEHTRVQRDEIIELAKDVRFNMKSRVNNCQVWSSKHLQAMVSAGRISKEIYDRIRVECPLNEEVPEPRQQ